MRIYKPKSGGRWYVEFRDRHRKIRRFAGFQNRSQTETFGSNIKKLMAAAASGDPAGPELMAWVNQQPDSLKKRLAGMGLISKRQVVKGRPLEDLLGDFALILLDGRGTPKQAALVMSRLRKVVAGCKADRWDELTKKEVVTFLNNRLASEEISKRTYNFYVKHCRRFGRWLKKELGLAESPFEDLAVKRFNKRTDQVHERRALTLDEAMRLLSETKDGPDRYGMSGLSRYLCYRLAIESGLRRKELRALTPDPDSFDFHACTVTVLGNKTKNKQDCVVPLRKDTAAEIKEYCTTFMPGAKLFKIPDKSSDMIAEDLEAAGIDYVDLAGRFADFHALRHCCGTRLANAKVHPKTAQEIMRHSDIRLTMDYYTHFMTGEGKKAVESLPDLSGEIERKKRTGTDKI